MASSPIRNFSTRLVLSSENLDRGTITKEKLQKFWILDERQRSSFITPGLEKELSDFNEELDSVKQIEIGEERYTKLDFPYLDFYKKCMDLEKSKALYDAFNQATAACQLVQPSSSSMKERIIKYSNYIGCNQELTKSILLKKSFSEDKKKFIEIFCQKLASLYPRLRSFTSDSPIVVIGTSSSGGAHKSISNAIFERLKQDLKFTEEETSSIKTGYLNNRPILKVIDETAVADCDEDPLKKCTGIAYSRCYSEIEQKLNKPSYNAKLRELARKLALFIPYPHTKKIKELINGTKYFVSTSHHDYNVRLLAEGVDELNFQICDFGAISPKLREVAKTTYKYGLLCIKFFAPAESTYLDYTTRRTSRKIEIQELQVKQMIAAIGYPVKLAFTNPHLHQEAQQKKELFSSTNHGEKKIFILMGAQGVGSIVEKYINIIIEKNKEIPMIVLVGCGNNNQMKDNIDKIREQNNKRHLSIQAIGFTTDIPYIGSLSDVFVTKPGGGTIAEAIYAGFPLLIHKNEKAPWEFGNIEEAKLAELGSVITSDEKFYNEIEEILSKPRPRRREYPKNDPVTYISLKLNIFTSSP